MTDIFDAKIVCKKCGREMRPKVVEREGLQLRAVECLKCKDKIVHPADMNCLNKFHDMKDKTFNVKLRVVGNSHAISIPKEIVELQRQMHERHKNISREMEDMVKLAFEDFGRLRVTFWEDENEDR